jgi:hypothetical protein
LQTESSHDVAFGLLLLRGHHIIPAMLQSTGSAGLGAVSLGVSEALIEALIAIGLLWAIWGTVRWDGPRRIAAALPLVAVILWGLKGFQLEYALWALAIVPYMVVVAIWRRLTSKPAGQLPLRKSFLAAIAGATFGIFAGGLVVLAIIALLSGDESIRPGNLASAIPWAALLGSPGALPGAFIGVFVCWRAQTVSRIQRLLAESICVSAIASAAIIQLLLPMGGELPRARIVAIAVVIASAVAAAGTWSLRLLYWPAGQAS